MDFWRELWSEYRELAKSLVGVVLELVCILAVIKIGAWLIKWMEIKTSCEPGEWIDCLHTIVLLIAWGMLLGSFVIVAAVFTYRHTSRRFKEIDWADQAQNSREYTAAITGALAALEPSANDSDRIRAMQSLLNIRETYPTDRKAALFLGRLYKTRQDYEGAISAVSFFIAAKEKRGERDVDCADLLYNRACYRVLAAQRDLAGEARARAIETALHDLERAIQLSSDNAEAARADADFASIVADARFARLVNAQVAGIAADPVAGRAGA